MDVHTGEHADKKARTRTVMGVVAGILVALAGIGIVWWQDWGFSFGAAWFATKLGVKVGALVAAGAFGAFAWWRGRRAPQETPGEMPASAPEEAPTAAPDETPAPLPDETPAAPPAPAAAPAAEETR
ncbi:hypothetical protein [Streptomyces sp. NPDC000410]|uniref:hypothetical protein n=1 Tax=Streptomyces sp. NPDC000410 TaxID=3154254 RepID=UPI0033181E47